MQLFLLIILFLLALGVGLGVIFLAYWPLYGAPFVPTENNEIKDIFKKIKLKSGQTFCDLGCGDGRIVFAAHEWTRMQTIGIDINWGLIIYDKIMARIKKINNIKFIRANCLKIPLPKADVYFTYFWPKAIEKLAEKFEKEKLNKISLVSKSFQILRWKRFLVDKFMLNGRTFWVYELPTIPE